MGSHGKKYTFFLVFVTEPFLHAAQRIRLPILLLPSEECSLRFPVLAGPLSLTISATISIFEQEWARTIWNKLCGIQKIPLSCHLDETFLLFLDVLIRKAFDPEFQNFDSQ